MKRCAGGLLLALLLAVLASAAGSAEGLDFFEEILSARTVEEVYEVADAHGIALAKATQLATTYLCEGVRIGGIPAYLADVYITEDGAMTLPLAYFLIPEEESGEALSTAPGATYDALLKTLAARYGAPYFTGITLFSRDSLWFFDGLAVRLAYTYTPENPPYLTLEILRNIAGIGDPALTGFVPGRDNHTADAKAPASQGLTGEEYIDRLSAAASIAGESFRPSVLLVEMGNCVFFQTTYGDIILNVTTDAETGRVSYTNIPMNGSKESLLAMCAIFQDEQEMLELESLAAWGEEAMQRALAGLEEGHIFYRDGAYGYATGYDRADGSDMLLISIQ